MLLLKEVHSQKQCNLAVGAACVFLSVLWLMYVLTRSSVFAC